MAPKVAAKKVLNKSPQTADNTFQKTTCLVFTPPPYYWSKALIFS